MDRGTLGMRCWIHCDLAVSEIVRAVPQRPKRRPGKDRQTQIDRRRIERIDRLGQIHPEGFFSVQATRDAECRGGGAEGF
jgi:hypothetical protein